MLRRILGRILRLLGLVGLPGDVRIWWNILTPTVPTALTGLWAYGQQASLPVLVLLVLAVYVVSLLASIPVVGTISRLRLGQRPNAPQDATSDSTHLPQTIQAGSIGSIGSVAGDLHINIASPAQDDEPPDEDGPDAEPDYETRQHFEDEAVHLPIFPLALDGDIYVRDRTFKNCRIYGPAVIAPSVPSTYGDTFLGNCTFYGDADAILWLAPEDRSGYIGLIAFEGCVFDGCDFYRVGLLMPEEGRSLWLEHWQEQQRELEEGSEEPPELESSDEEPTNQ